MRSYDYLDVSMDDDVLRIAFDTPEKYNPINGHVHEELSYVFREATTSDAKVVVLTGNGDAFSAGGDLDWMQECIEDTWEWDKGVTEHVRIYEDILSCGKPIVARVNGDAVGAGVNFALICDIVVADEDAKLGDVHVNAGLAAGDGGQVIFPFLTDVHTAKEMLMTGKIVTGAEAEEMGLVNYAVPAEELDAKVDEIVSELKEGPQLAMQYTKLMINQLLKQTANTNLLSGLSLEALNQKYPDHKEAVDAFRNDRRPDFPSASDGDDGDE
jgi:enoyl-CoA hydratase